MWRPCAGAVAAIVMVAAGRGTPDPADVGSAIRLRVAQVQNTSHRLEVTTLYTARSDAPLWVDASGVPGRNTAIAVALLESALADGLDPHAYRRSSSRSSASAGCHACRIGAPSS